MNVSTESPIVSTQAPSALAEPPPAKAARGGIVPFRLTVEQFLGMIDAGILTDRDRVELLGGILVRKMTKHDPHDFAVDNLSAILGRLLPDDWIVRQEKSIVLGKHWRPEPDIAVVRGPRERYRGQAPRVEDIGMLVEVADASYAADRGVKRRRYAACKVASYWIVNIPGRAIEVHAGPDGEGASAGYRDWKSFGPEDEVPVAIDGREVGRVAARDVLP